MARSWRPDRRPASGGPTGDLAGQILLPPDEARRRKRRAARQLHVVHIPLLRLGGLAVLAVLVWAYGRFVLGRADFAPLLTFAAVAVPYCAVSWGLLALFYGRWRRLDLGALFLSVDVCILLLAVHCTGGTRSPFFWLMILRVADQTNTSFRRVLWFAHFSPFAYLGLVAVTVLVQHQPVDLSLELLKVLGMYASSLYVAMTARTAESVRGRMRAFLHIARSAYRELMERSRALETARSEIELQNAALTAQADDLLRNNRELRVAKHEAESMRLEAEMASRAKSEFLANMSHEIRTPMNAILGFTELLLDDELGKEQREQLDIVRDSGRNLLALINEILDFSKIEAGGFEIEPVEFDLHDHFRTTLAMLRPRFDGRDLRLESAVRPAVPRVVVADPLRIRQVLVNLVGNAAKFTERGGVQVTLELQAAGAGQCSVRYVVADTGIGIAAEERRHIFEPFTQADGSATRRFGGTGLGLAISQRLVELMGGVIDLESEPGLGTTFRVTLPLALPVARPAAPPAAPPDGAAAAAGESCGVNRRRDD